MKIFYTAILFLILVGIFGVGCWIQMPNNVWWSNKQLQGHTPLIFWLLINVAMPLITSWAVLVGLWAGASIIYSRLSRPTGAGENSENHK